MVVCNGKPSSKQEHSIDATTQRARPHSNRLRRPPPGGQCRADPSGYPRQHLCLRELVGNHVDLGNAPGRANTGDKILTLVASALAGGDCIDDADVLRTGGTAGAIGCVVKAPSTLPESATLASVICETYVG